MQVDIINMFGFSFKDSIFEDLNSTCKFSNLWHSENWNIFSWDKSTIELGKHPNWEQSDKFNFTKLSNFPNSISRFSNLSHPCNRNVSNYDKSTIELGKHPNWEQPNKSSSTKLWSFSNSIGRFSNLLHPAIEMS